VGCDGGFQLHLTALASAIDAVSMVGPGDVWIGGANSPRLARREPGVADGGFRAPPGAACGDDATALAARSDGRVYLGTTSSSDLQRLDGVGATCTVVGAGVTSAQANGLVAFTKGGGVELFAVFADGQIAHRGDGVSISETWSPVSELWDIQGPDATTLWAFGRDTAGAGGVIVRLQPDGGWARELSLGGATTFYTASYVDPTHVYAAGSTGLVYRFDGGAWAAEIPSPGFAVSGLQAYSATEMYAVGASGLVRFWNGTQWITAADFTAVTSQLHRVRGTGVCDTWVVGNNGLVATTNRR
jgi:hypothetical protein